MGTLTVSDKISGLTKPSLSDDKEWGRFAGVLIHGAKGSGRALLNVGVHRQCKGSGVWKKQAEGLKDMIADRCHPMAQTGTKGAETERKRQENNNAEDSTG